MASMDMLRTIKQYVGRLPVELPLRKELKKGGVSLFLFDAKWSGERYSSLLVPFTNGFIFGTVTPAIGDGFRKRDLFAIISSNMKFFNSRKEYEKNRWQLKDYEQIEDWCIRLMEQQFSYLVGKATCYFQVINLEFGVHPIPTLVLYYALGGVLQEPIVFVLNQKIVMPNTYIGRFRDDFFYFIEDLNLQDFYCWEEGSEHDDRRRIVE